MVRKHKSRLRPESVYTSIDVLRGVAVLGILVVNVWIFALPEVGYIDVTAKGGDAFLNLVCWVISGTLIEGKMRALLSILFGAGVILLTSRIEARGGKAQVTDIYYRRTILLLVFGVAQAYLLIWAADFIYAFALVGMLLFPFRKMRAEGLVAIGLLLLAVLVPLRIHWSYQVRTAQAAVANDQAEQESDASAEGVKSASASPKEDSSDGSTKTQTASPESDEGTSSPQQESSEVKDDTASSEAIRRSLWIAEPPGQSVEEQTKLKRSGYWAIFKKNGTEVVDFQSTRFYTRYFWDVGGMMLIGMGLAKLGVFLTERKTGVPVLFLVGGYGVGLPLSVLMVSEIVVSRFDEAQLFTSWIVYDLARLAVALGHVGLVMLICRAGLWLWLTDSLAAAGRMALSNYIAQTVICTLVFNGYGLGFYGRPQLWHTCLLATVIGICQLIISTYWLRFFCFGPMEWLWRSLTYWKRQPMLASRTAVPAVAGS